MNITIVCGHYLPQMGYIEVHLARAMSVIGHQVSVITTSAVPKYVKHLHNKVVPGFEMDGKVRVLRMRPVLSIGQIVIANRLNQKVTETNPDLIFVIGLGKRFPKPVFNLPYRIVTLLGDNDYSYAPGSMLATQKSKLLFRFLKKSVYHKALDNSDVLVAYTPQSFDAAASLLSTKYQTKLLQQKTFISLGFWPEEFHFDPDQRRNARLELGYQAEQIIVITTTRVVPEKNLEKVLGMFKSLPHNWVWLLVGTDDGAYSRQFVNDSELMLGNRFRHIKFQNRQKLLKLYNVADLAIYTHPAISIFEALGSGLFCVIPKLRSLEHILDEGFNGFYFNVAREENLFAKGTELDFSETGRFGRAHMAANRFSWTFIAQKLCKL